MLKNDSTDAIMHKNDSSARGLLLPNLALPTGQGKSRSTDASFFNKNLFYYFFA